MLIGELVEILEAVLEDYRKFNILQLLQNVVNILGARQSTSQQIQAYTGTSQEVHRRINEIVLAQNPLLETERAKSVIEASAYPGVLPRDIAAQARIMLPQIMDQAAQSSEGQILLQKVQQANSAFSSFCSIARAFHQNDFQFSSEKLLFVLTMPDTSQWTLSVCPGTC